MLPCFTSNTADVLKLKQKGRLQENADADVLVIQEKSHEIVHLFAKGRQCIKDSRLVFESQQEKLLREGQP